MKMIFMGRKSYAAEMLKWSVDKGIDVPFVCTDSQFPNSPTMKMAEQLGISVISMEEAEDYVESHPEDIDLVVSYLYWRKIRKPLILLPRFGCINFHPAILPDWRGTAGYNIAILEKLSEWGATAHYVDEEIDTGSIIRVFRFNFDYRNETALSLEKKTQGIQTELYKSVILDVLDKGRIDSIKQNGGDGVYISRKKMNEMKVLDINSLDKEDIDLKIRAFWFPPYDGANIEINGRHYTLINEEILKTLQPENTTSLI